MGPTRGPKAARWCGARSTCLTREVTVRSCGGRPGPDVLTSVGGPRGGSAPPTSDTGLRTRQGGGVMGCRLFARRRGACADSLIKAGWGRLLGALAVRGRWGSGRRRSSVVPMRRVLALTTLAATAVGVVPAASVAHGAGFTFPRQFAVPQGGNQQGLAYGDGRFYVAFDLDGNGSARIVAYDAAGHEVRRSGGLPLGHAAELSYRQANGNLYVADGTPGRPCRVTVVDMRQNP